MKALIFGGGGQDGFYLKGALERRGISVVAPLRSPSGVGDVANLAFVEEAIRGLHPDYIFHLAARSTTHHSALWENHAAIATGALNVLESAYRHSASSRVFIPGSGVQFLNVGAKVDEDTPFHAGSPYAVARIQSVYAARYYRSLGVRSYVGYLFHHESPRRPANHVSRMVADAARAAHETGSCELAIGDISVVKEWTHASDVVDGMLRLVEQDEIHEAIIGSGVGHSIEEWLAACFGHFGLDWQEHVQVIPGFKPEYRRLVSNPSRMLALGWKPSIGFEALAEQMLER